MNINISVKTPISPVIIKANNNSIKNNSNIEVRFRDIYPISLSGLDYNQQATDVNYLTASVTFQYKIYEFANVSGSGVLETTT